MMTTIAGTVLDVDAEGFLQKPDQWNEEIAREIARDVGIEPLTDRHWLVLLFMRNTFLDKGQAPSIRTLGKESGVPVKELYQLLADSGAKLYACKASVDMLAA